MSVSVLLPELGESVVEATVAKWLVKEGEAVERDQPLVEVTTDKVDAEIPAPEAGVLISVLAAEGETVPVGAELAKIDTQATATATPSTAAEPSAAPAANAGGPKATPVATRVAEDRGVDLSSVEGSGRSGRIQRADVEKAASKGSAGTASAPVAAPAPSAPAAPAVSASSSAAKQRFGYYAIQEGDKVVPMSPLRKIVAEHMVYSKQTSPHVGTVAEVDMGGVASVRAGAKAGFKEAHGFNLTFLPFIVQATVRALREFPVLNASVIEDAIVEKRDINIGVAVETEKGLVVPVVRNADRLSLAGLAAEIEDLSTRARSKRLSADDLQGGSFTISNPGRQGNLYGFAIINQPQVGILRMGEMVKRPVVRSVEGSDAIVIRPMMHIALSYDHRAVDGAPANGFLYRVRELLEEADFDL